MSTVSQRKDIEAIKMNIIPKQYTNCLRCGRKLKNPEYRARGYGKVCWEKMQKSSTKKLF